MRPWLSRHGIWLVCGLGSVLRLLYGWHFTPWLYAPDHLAWQIALDAGGWSYDQLIHYPHEGGSLVVSLLGRVIGSFTTASPLVIAVFTLDFVSRFIQIRVAQLVFHPLVAWSFGLWTIAAAPSIIPWATTSFGLHALAACWPFVLLYLIWSHRDTRAHHLAGGLWLGLACWFHYSNVVLIPVYVLYVAMNRPRTRHWPYAMGSLAAVLFFHVVVRQYADAGFHLEVDDLTSIRGTTFSLNQMDTWKGIYRVWTGALVEAAMSTRTAYPEWGRFAPYAWLSLFLAGMYGFLTSFSKDRQGRLVAINLSGAILFILVYAISPFHYQSDSIGTFVAYRHLTYVLPLLSLCIIAGLHAFGVRSVLIAAFLLLGIGASGLLFTGEVPATTAERAAGWVLGVKFGHDPGRLAHIISSSVHDQDLLARGAGWGMSTALFRGIPDGDQDVIDQRVETLTSLVQRFPADRRPALIEGITFSFSDQVLPRLNRIAFDRFLLEIDRRGSSRN